MLTEYIYPSCPIFRSQDPFVRFVKKSVRADYIINEDAMGIKPSPIYRGILKKDWKPPEWADKDIGMYEAKQFLEIKQVYDPMEQLRGIERTKYIPNSGKYKLAVKKDAQLDSHFQKPKHSGLGMYEAFKMYTSFSYFYITDQLTKDLQALKIRMSKPIRVYRGLSLFSKKIWDKLEIGQIVKLNDIYPASSWTTEICVAAGFGYQGVVVEYLAQPEEVVIDTRLLEPKVLSSLYEVIQYEVMLDKRDRDVKVKLIIQNHQPVATYQSA